MVDMGDDGDIAEGGVAFHEVSREKLLCCALRQVLAALRLVRALRMPKAPVFRFAPDGIEEEPSMTAEKGQKWRERREGRARKAAFFLAARQPEVNRKAAAAQKKHCRATLLSPMLWAGPAAARVSAAGWPRPHRPPFPRHLPGG
ncbi:MAG: hypothetical protein K2J64_04600, partial [Desulfovibrio sp.]|nr:hypothetical protein [Desulfovibrio sp.]